MAKKILIVEDDDLCMKLFKDLLGSHGFDTLQSFDGQDILRLAREHRPDLIVMDIRLPHVSGLEHTRSLKADKGLKDIPVIAVSGFAMIGDEKKILNAGCDAYLAKPISVPLFLEQVKKFLAMGPFRLTASLITGHAEIDAEHDHLGVLLNQFVDLLKENDSQGHDQQINVITRAIKDHFVHEEEVMNELGYNNFEQHKEEHAEILIKLEALTEEAKKIGYSGKFVSELTAILVQDMIRADLGFKEYLQEINYRGRAA